MLAQMPSGVRSPWAAADWCLRTRSVALSVQTCACTGSCQALAHAVAMIRSSATASIRFCKRSEIAVSGRYLRSVASLPVRPAPFRTKSPKGGWKASRHAVVLFHASFRPEPCLHVSAPHTAFKLSVPNLKAAVSHIRRPTRGCLSVGYTANYPCSYRGPYYHCYSGCYNPNIRTFCASDKQKLRLLSESRKQKMRELSTAPAPSGG